MESAFHARLCRPGACFAAVEAGLELAAASGIRGLNHTLALQGVYGGLAAGDLAAARRYHRLAAESLGPREAINNAHHRQLAAWVALCASDLAEAEAHAEAAFDHGRVSGASISVGWLEHTLATVRLEQGREAEGLERLDRALRWARDTRNPIVEHHCLLTQAWAHALRGRDDDAAAVLRIALALGRERGFATHPWIGWRRDAMARLDGIALARGIEPDQVRAGARARAGGLVGAGAPATASSRRSRTGSGRRRASSARRPR
jgi:tetratricopeptide (TPR) repeat protein